MKHFPMKAIFFLPAIITGSSLFAQQTSGIITYQQTITADIDNKDLPEDIAKMIPREFKTEKVLYFSPDATLYANGNKAKDNEGESYSQDNIMIHIEHKEPDEKIYTHVQDKKIVEQRDLMGRQFLVTKDGIESAKWKFTGRQKKILDLPCMEAVSINGDDSTIVWYTPSIPVQGGPETLSGLPGMILEANIGSSIHVAAVKIGEANDEIIKQIKEPTKGKKISSSDFEKLVKQKQEEMQKEYGGKGNRIIMKHTVR